MKEIVPYFVHCEHLIVRTDLSHNSPEDYKHIALIECKAYKDKLRCPTNGKCVVARDSDTWNMIKRNDFLEKKK